MNIDPYNQQQNDSPGSVDSAMYTLWRINSHASDSSARFQGYDIFQRQMVQDRAIGLHLQWQNDRKLYVFRSNAAILTTLSDP